MAYQVTGNEYLSLPTIRENDGAVEGVTFLYMQVKGLLEIRGKDGLIRPYVELDGQRLPLCPVWSREHCWIPRFVSEEQALRFTCTYLTPVGERALVLRLSVQNQNAEPRTVRFGTDGRWDQTLHEVNETTELTEGREAYGSGWNHMFIFSQKPGLPLFAFAPCVADPQQFAEIDQQARWNRSDFAYDIYRETVLQPGETAVLDIPWGVGYEGVAASTSAKELLRQGFDAVYDRTVRWLSAREKPLADPKLHELLNTNLFFAFFYASGRTVDTEELCLMTSRSPRYYVSAAYWDRDSLLWAFPAILTVDAAYAREILTYVFTRQARNFGVHSRFIDGTMLEPGFELDELCAPVIALDRYVEKTGDTAFAARPFDSNIPLCDILNQHVLAIVRLHKIRTQEAIVRAAPILARGFAVLTFCNRRINLALSKQLGAGIVLRFNLFSLALRQIIRARAFPLMPYHRARIFSVAGRRLAIQRTLAGERDVLLAVCVNKRRIVHQFY